MHEKKREIKNNENNAGRRREGKTQMSIFEEAQQIIAGDYIESAKDRE